MADANTRCAALAKPVEMPCLCCQHTLRSAGAASTLSTLESVRIFPLELRALALQVAPPRTLRSAGAAQRGAGTPRKALSLL